MPIHPEEISRLRDNLDQQLRYLESVALSGDPQVTAHLQQIIKVLRNHSDACMSHFYHGAHPIGDPRLQHLAKDFLAYKNRYGSEAEKVLYQNMTFQGLLVRLLTKRPLTFYLPSDTFFHVHKKTV
jgi:hypothetical protein